MDGSRRGFSDLSILLSSALSLALKAAKAWCR
jgi:hypothetical protein